MVFNVPVTISEKAGNEMASSGANSTGTLVGDGTAQCVEIGSALMTAVRERPRWNGSPALCRGKRSDKAVDSEWRKGRMLVCCCKVESMLE